MNIDNFNVHELNTNEMSKVNGGLPIFRLRGFLDGIKGNTEVRLFFWDL
jgi:bacteriocin-like protein